jgi:acid phosphatase
VLLATVLAGCAGPERGAHEMLNAVLWQQDSAEYRALAMQSYALAAMRLDEALAAPGWSAALEQGGDASGLPPAVVLDLDETVVDNARYEARIVTRLGEYDRESFARWCEEGGAAVVPGAGEFLAHARSRGVAVFFYTAREERLRDCTLRTLRAAGIAPLDPATVFLRGAGAKSEIRRRIAATHRILLLIGDSLEDFVHGSKGPPEARRALVRRHRAWVGERWIVLPNAMYGHWEATLYGFDYATPRGRKLEVKRSALRP